MRTVQRDAPRVRSVSIFVATLVAAISCLVAKADEPDQSPLPQKTVELVALSSPAIDPNCEDPNLLRFIVRTEASTFAPRLLDLVHIASNTVWAQDYKQALRDVQSARPNSPAVEEKLRNFDDSLLGATQTVVPAVGVISKVVNPDDTKVPANVIYVRFSKPFLETYFCKQYERTLPVRDVVLGADVYGRSHTTARTELGLVDNPSKAQANLVFRGTTAFNTTSYKGPVQIYSHGTTQFTIQKLLSFDGVDLQQSGPKSWADTNTITDGISTDLPRLRGRIALRIASQRSAETHELAEQICNERTKHKVERAFEGVVKERTSVFSQQLKEQYAKLPFRGRFALQAIQCSTTPDTLQLVVLGRGENEPMYAPAPVALKDNPDVELHIHTALVQKAIFDPELRATLQLAVQSMVENPMKAAVTTIRTAATSEPKRELHIHWMEGEGEWLSLAWHAKEKPEAIEASTRGTGFVSKSASAIPLVASPVLGQSRTAPLP